MRYRVDCCFGPREAVALTYWELRPPPDDLRGDELPAAGRAPQNPEESTSVGRTP